MTRAANRKSPGPDRIPTFWIKQFNSLHKPMAEAYSEIIKNPKQTQEWLVEGATNLLTKKEEIWIPKNYRPIPCLPTTFKILTSVITDRLYSHLEERSHHDTRTERRKNRLPWMQGSVDDQQCYLRKLQEEKKNLPTAWKGYKKAFDSVPHSWILKCLQMYKIHPVLITFIEESRSQ